jgi:hypothetical protein
MRATIFASEGIGFRWVETGLSRVGTGLPREERA